MQSRKYYEAYWSQYDDVVTLNEFRKYLLQTPSLYCAL